MGPAYQNIIQESTADLIPLWLLKYFKTLNITLSMPFTFSVIRLITSGDDDNLTQLHGLAVASNNIYTIYNEITFSVQVI